MSTKNWKYAGRARGMAGRIREDTLGVSVELKSAMNV